MGPALALALAALLWSAPCESQPRGSSLVGAPGSRAAGARAGGSARVTSQCSAALLTWRCVAGPPVLSSLSPGVGVPEGSVLLTLRGANFRRSRGLAVRFATADAAVVVPATFVDASTVGARMTRAENANLASSL